MVPPGNGLGLYLSGREPVRYIDLLIIYVVILGLGLALWRLAE